MSSNNPNPIQTFIKNFTDWFKLKPKLDNQNKIPLFEEREIWYCSFGENIGTEISGKNNPKYTQKLFLRPVLIFKKLNNQSFIGIPLTTKQKNRTWFYPILINGVSNRMVFSQIRSLDARRLNFSMYKITKAEFDDIEDKFIQFLGKK